MAKSKSIEELPEQALQGRIKVFWGILGVIGVVALTYLGYYIYLFATGTFDSSRHLLGIVAFLGMMAASLPSVMLIGKYKAELNRRRQA